MEGGLMGRFGWRASRIATLDLAVNKTGLAFFKDGVLLEEELHLFTKEPAKGSDPRRTTFINAKTVLGGFKQIRDGILRVLSQLAGRHGVDMVLLEDFAFSAQGRAIFELGQINGVVRLALTEAGYNLQLISPSAVKKIITGKGNADKKMVMLRVYQLCGIDLMEFGRGAEDLYDAIAIGYAYLNKRKKV